MKFKEKEECIRPTGPSTNWVCKQDLWEDNISLPNEIRRFKLPYEALHPICIRIIYRLYLTVKINWSIDETHTPPVRQRMRGYFQMKLD